MKRFSTEIRGILVVLLTLASGAMAAQTIPSTTCSNSNFSTGTFLNWTGCYGTFANPCITAGFDTASTCPVHKIITDVAALDPNTCNSLLKIYPGETHSVRLGHDCVTGSVRGSMLKYTIPVSTIPYYFKFIIAVVMQNPAHTPSQQPNFTFSLTDQSGNALDPGTNYRYYSYSFGQAGWQVCTTPNPQVAWKDWAVDSIDLSPYYGQTVVATFTSKDCQPGGHFGYAYLTAYCMTPVTREWTGLVSNLWNNPANWNPAGIPTYMDTVVIPVTAPVMPLINVNGMVCTTLQIADGATVTIPPGIKLTVSGDVIIGNP